MQHGTFSNCSRIFRTAEIFDARSSGQGSRAPGAAATSYISRSLAHPDTRNVTSPRAHPPLAAYGCLALSMSLVGSYVALTKPLAVVFPVFLLAWLRFGIGGIAMLGWVRRPANEPPLSRQTRLLLSCESG